MRREYPRSATRTSPGETRYRFRDSPPLKSVSLTSLMVNEARSKPRWSLQSVPVFPGAQIVAVRQPDVLQPQVLPPVNADDDELPPDMPIDDGDSEPAFGADGPPPDYWDDL